MMMKVTDTKAPSRNLRCYGVGAALLTVLATSFGASFAQEIGVNAAIKNEVSIQSVGETEARTTSVGADVKLRDVIRSGNNSALQILLLDETTFTVGSRARLTIDKFVYDPDRGTGEVAASVARGAFRFMSGRTARRPGAVKINTPVASMGVRGTIVEGAVGREDIQAILDVSSQFEGVPLGDDSTLIVLRGPGEEQNGLNKDGVVIITNETGSVTLTRPNTALLIAGPGQPIIGPFPLRTGATARLRASLGTIPTTDDPITGIPDVIVPSTGELDIDILIEPVVDIEEEQIIDRPTDDCPISDGIPVTGGGLILGGSGGMVVGDFGEVFVNCQGGGSNL